MDIHRVAVLLLLHGALTEAKKEALRINVGKILTVRQRSPVENPSKLMTFIITNKNKELNEKNPSIKYMEPMLPLIESLNSEEEDKSGESNSDENSDFDTDLDSDSESSYYHEDDYLREKIMKEIQLRNAEKNELELLRNRWKSCQKSQAKTCTKACKASYKNACEQEHCKSKLKKLLKKECKLNCKDLFME